MKLSDIPLLFESKFLTSCEVIRAEYGRTYSHYVCFVFSDNSKVMLSSQGVPYNPNPSAEEMKEAPTFFSSEDIAEKVKHDEDRRRARIQQAETQERAQYERLKRKFEKEG